MEKINIAELLKNCPTGMELDCTMYEDVYFDYVDELNIIHCYIQHGTYKMSLILNQFGTHNSHLKSKCIIFPKGKTTWEGFQKPFKDGDIVATDNGRWLGIIKNKSDIEYYTVHCIIDCTFNALFYRDGEYYFSRLATEEEKEKLFDAIKDNGYKWNPETKTLEKLIVPKFKVGDVIQDKDGYKVKITDVSVEDECYGYESMILNGIGGIAFSRQDDWKLVPNKFDINTLKPFESRVLVRNIGAWEPAFWGYYSKEYAHPFVVTGGNTFAQCVPYEENQHLLGTTNDCDEYYKTWE